MSDEPSTSQEVIRLFCCLFLWSAAGFGILAAFYAGTTAFSHGIYWPRLVCVGAASIPIGFLYLGARQ